MMKDFKYSKGVELLDIKISNTQSLIDIKRKEINKLLKKKDRIDTERKKLQENELSPYWNDFMYARTPDDINWDFVMSKQGYMESAWPKPEKDSYKTYGIWNDIISNAYKCKIEKKNFSFIYGKIKTTSFTISPRKENHEGLNKFLTDITGKLKQHLKFIPILEYEWEFCDSHEGNYLMIDLNTSQLSKYGIDTLLVREDGKKFIVFRYSRSWIKEEFVFDTLEKCTDFLCTTYYAPDYCVVK